MTAPISHSSLLASALLWNPVSCPVTPHAKPATHVVEAVFVNGEDVDRHRWLVCADAACQADIQLHVESFAPDSYELRPATVAELELVSGLDVTSSIAGAA